MTVELLLFEPQSGRTEQLFRALGAGVPAGVQLQVTREFQGGSDCLMLWGPGAPNRFGPMRAQLAAGGHVLAWDLAYWQRDSKLRVSIDGAHPPAWLYRRPLDGSRLAQDGVQLEDAYQAGGPVLVAGIGRKARVQYGEGAVLGWEADRITEARRLWPSRRVLYRRKQADAPMPPGVDVELAGDGPIDHVLRGCSAVVTWHSNVAVDAVRLGVPVYCRDGAAAVLSPAGLRDVAPLPREVRQRFLEHLAWFQWAPAEAAGFWQFVQATLG